MSKSSHKNYYYKTLESKAYKRCLLRDLVLSSVHWLTKRTDQLSSSEKTGVKSRRTDHEQDSAQAAGSSTPELRSMQLGSNRNFVILELSTEVKQSTDIYRAAQNFNLVVTGTRNKNTGRRNKTAGEVCALGSRCGRNRSPLLHSCSQWQAGTRIK